MSAEGIPPLTANLIKRELDLSVGDTVGQNQLEDSQVRINLLGYVGNTRIQLKKGTERGKVKLIIEVDELSAYYGESRFGYVDFR